MDEAPKKSFVGGTIFEAIKYTTAIIIVVLLSVMSTQTKGDEVGAASDNLLCFRATDPLMAKVKADFTTIIPEFSQTGCTIGRAVNLCMAAEKQNVSPPAVRPDIMGEPAGLFIEYNVSCPRTSTSLLTLTEWLVDPFGQHKQQRYLAQTVLVPAVMGDTYPQRLGVMIGDSTTVSASYFGPLKVSSMITGDILKNSLRLQSRGDEIMMLALPGLTSQDWAVAPDPDTCTYWNNWAASANDSVLNRVLGIKVIKAACANHTSMISNITQATKQAPNFALVVLGANDKFSADQTVQNLQTIQNSLASSSVKVLIGSPFRAHNDLQPRLAQITQLLKTRGMLTGPDFNSFDFTTIDGVHLTQGGYMAAAGLWFDAVRSISQ